MQLKGARVFFGSQFQRHFSPSWWGVCGHFRAWEQVVHEITDHEAGRTEPDYNFQSSTSKNLFPPTPKCPQPSEQCHLLVNKLQYMSLWGTFQISTKASLLMALFLHSSAHSPQDCLKSYFRKFKAFLLVWVPLETLFSHWLSINSSTRNKRTPDTDLLRVVEVWILTQAEKRVR